MTRFASFTFLLTRYFIIGTYREFHDSLLNKIEVRFMGNWTWECRLHEEFEKN